MRRFLILALAACLCACCAAPAFAESEENITRIKTILQIEEPAGMGYVSETTGFCDLMPMDDNTETFYAIWDVLGSAPLYSIEIPEGEPASPMMRYVLPERDDSTRGFKVLTGETGEDFLLMEMYDGWNLVYISVCQGGEVTEFGWYMAMNAADMEILDAVGTYWEGISE